jgi:hypothetical protein
LSTDFTKINTERVKILPTIGMYLADVLDLYRTGPVLEKKPGPKIWSVKSEIRQVGVPQIEGLLYLIKHHVTKMYGGMEAQPLMAVRDQLHTVAFILGRKLCTGHQVEQASQNQFGYCEVQEPVLALAGIELKLLCSIAHNLLVTTN